MSDAIDRKLVYAFLFGLISDDVERKKALEYVNELPPVPTKTEKWIPVKESLPKTAREVRVTDGTDVFIGWYDGTEWCSSSELFWPDTHPITAWMPYHIPKPYKEEKD